MTVGFYGMVTKSKRTTKGKRGEPGRFVTLKSGRVIFIPKGYKKKWSDVKERIEAARVTGPRIWEAEALAGPGLVHTIGGGSGIPKETVSAAQRTNTGVIPVAYTAKDNKWHFATTDARQALHAEFSAEAAGVKNAPGKERAEVLDSLVVHGVWDSKDHVLELYDNSEEVYGAYRASDPLKARRLSNRSKQSRRKAVANMFTWEGEIPLEGTTEYGIMERRGEMQVTATGRFR